MTAARALGWEFWLRHRRGFLALGAYLVLLAVTRIVIVTRGVTVSFDHETEFALVVITPISCSILYLLAVFTHGMSGDVAARESMYPARLLTLPVSNAALVGWPMLYGVGAVVVFAVASRALTSWPVGLVIPVLWPPVLAASLMMWTQAATWMPYPFRGARLLAAVLVLQALNATVLLALHFGSPEWVVLAITLPQLPVAYALARYAVARARRGATFERTPAAAGPVTLSRARGTFPSAAHAQAWFEWKRHGRALPLWVAIVLPFVLLILWTAGTSTALVVITLLGALVTPVVLALFTGVTFARAGGGSDWFGLPSFSAVRPLTDDALLAAKLKMTVRSALAAWAVVAVAIPVALAWSGTWTVARDFARNVTGTIGPARAAALFALVVGVFMLSTWRQLVQSLCIALTGRERLIKGSVFASIVIASLLGPLAIWLLDEGRLGVVWSATPLILGVLVAAKMSVATWVAATLVRARALGPRALLGGAAAWTATVLALSGALAWLGDAPHVPRFLLLQFAILAVPLARLSAAPLALQQNRHRGGAEARAPVEAARRGLLAAVLAIAFVPAAMIPVLAARFYGYNRDSRSLVIGGIERTYELYVPVSYDSTRPAPLVISLHGAGLWGVAQRDMSRWNDVADAEGFLVAYPSARGGRGVRVWDVNPGHPRSPDNRFIAALIDTLSARYRIDPARVYANGLSNGGGMSFSLSCALSHRIAAVGLVGSAQTEPWNTCGDTSAVPMINFHGTDDRHAAYGGGTSWVLPDGSAFPSQRVWTARWAGRNRCAPTPTETTVTPTVTRRAYGGCAGGADVVLYTVHGGGHTWPGGGDHPEWFVGAVDRSIDASRLMWEFFRDHPRR